MGSHVATSSSQNQTSSTKMADDLKRIAGIKTSNPGNIAMACFDEAYYNGLSDENKARLLKIVKSGLENPDSEMGCYAMNPTDYDDFYPFFKQALSKYHKVDLDKTKHVNDWNLQGVEGLPADGVLDVSKYGLGALSMRIRTARNLKKFPLAGAMSQDDRVNMEKAMGPVFEELIKNPEFGGEYVSLTPGHKCFIDEARYNELVKAHIMFKDMSADSFLMDAGIACHWPHGRGCYFSADKGFIIWVGEEDHLRVMAMKKSTKMGTGMRASVHVAIPNLTKDGTDTKAKEICKPFGLGVRGLGGEHTPIGADGTVDISPKGRFCISEAQIAIALYKGVEKVWAEEQKA